MTPAARNEDYPVEGVALVDAWLAGARRRVVLLKNRDDEAAPEIVGHGPDGGRPRCRGDSRHPWLLE